MGRTDGKTYFFLNGKCNSLYRQSKNPRKIAWTVLYRRKHKKGLAVDGKKKKARKVAKYQRAVGSVEFSQIAKLRNEKSDFRKLQREQAIVAAKKAAKEAKAKAAKTNKAGGGGNTKAANKQKGGGLKR